MTQRRSLRRNELSPQNPNPKQPGADPEIRSAGRRETGAAIVLPSGLCSGKKFGLGRQRRGDDQLSDALGRVLQAEELAHQQGVAGARHDAGGKTQR